jgi:hypothetical protein
VFWANNRVGGEVQAKHLRRLVLALRTVDLAFVDEDQEASEIVELFAQEG